MDEEDIRPGGIVYLKFMRFPDDNTIDYKFNGRPYLIYKADEEYVYLLKIGSDTRHKEKEFYFKTSRKTLSNKKERDCYIDLRNLIKISKEKLIRKVNLLKSENRMFRGKIKYIPDKEFNRLQEQIDKICMIDEFRKIFSIWG